MSKAIEAICGLIIVVVALVFHFFVLAVAVVFGLFVCAIAFAIMQYEDAGYWTKAVIKAIACAALVLLIGWLFT
jgi:hypothetical protein